MLLALFGGYLTVASPPPPLLSAAAAPRPSARPPAPLPARLRPATRLVARRPAGPGEALSAAAAEEDEGEEGFPRWEGGNGEEDYDHDPEIGDIMGDYFDDPKKAQTRMEERVRKKRHKIVQAKTGSPNPMKVVFKKFDFSNSYIWFEFYNALLPKDVKLISDALRSWHIVGRLGGCNSMNMQLSQLPLDCKRPSYDALEGANVTPTSFYNIGDLEVQDNLARVWVDIGIHEPLLLDILFNALTTISSDHVGIKQVQCGGLEFESWNENLNTEEAGYSVRKI
ncbi:uncharacterized protein LOC133914163 [Phragmites australis]|uniref:uncharacterized protein LOC133914163 n=1 Tax=Phragmites australis TaxID=29695 RepID=UPI002D78AE3F|nr:uncharacterized protein LOC133914163 [Phragmites australis]